MSQRKERRLHDLLTALRHAKIADPAALRHRLFEHKPGSVRPYDLLSAGNFEAAVDLLTGRRQALPKLKRAAQKPITAHLDLLEDKAEAKEGRRTGRFSGRLRR